MPWMLTTSEASCTDFPAFLSAAAMAWDWSKVTRLSLSPWTSRTGTRTLSALFTRETAR